MWATSWNPPPGCHRVGYQEAFSVSKQTLLASTDQDVLKGETELTYEGACSSLGGSLRGDATAIAGAADAGGGDAHGMFST